MLFVIDNYDSFTYNLVQYLGELGADVKVMRNDMATLEDVVAAGPDRIVISPVALAPLSTRTGHAGLFPGMRRRNQSPTARLT